MTHDHSTSEIFLEQRTEYEANQQGRWMKVVTAQQRPGGSKEQHHINIKHAVLEAVRPNTDQDDNSWIELSVGNVQEGHPDTDERDIEHQEKQVSNPETCNKPTVKLRSISEFGPEQQGKLIIPLKFDFALPARTICILQRHGVKPTAAMQDFLSIIHDVASDKQVE
jgi:hypothetical protein